MCAVAEPSGMAGKTDPDPHTAIPDDAKTWAENASRWPFSLDPDQIHGSSPRPRCPQVEAGPGPPAAAKPADAEIRAQDAADEPYRRAKLVTADQGCAGRNVARVPDPACSDAGGIRRPGIRDQGDLPN